MLSVRKKFWAHTQHVPKSLNVLPLDLYFFAQHAQIKNFCQKNLMSRGKFKNKQYFLFSAQVNYPGRMY
jgi:hypothetical protein